MSSDPEPTATRLHEHARGLRELARSILGSTDGADDVVQDAFAAALERHRDGDAKPGWLAGVVRNLARRRLRDRQRRRVHEASAVRTDPAPPTDEVVAEVQMHRELVDAVSALGEPYRTVLVLRYWRALPPRAIARRTGVPVATVRTRLQRGLAMLRTRLDRRFGDRRAWLLGLVPIAKPEPLGALAGGMAVSVSAVALTMSAKKLLVTAAGVLLCTSLVFWALPDFSDQQPARAPAHPGGELRSTAAVAGDPAHNEVRDRPPGLDGANGNRRQMAEGHRTVAVTGRIVVDATGAPIAGATLRLVRRVPLDGFPERVAVTDEQGRFSLAARGWPSAGWIGYDFALASAPGLATREVPLDSRVQERIAAGVLEIGTLRLVRGVPVTGRVLGHDGQPLRDRARLLVWDPSSSTRTMYEGRTAGFTDADGCFALAERLTPYEGGELMLAAVTASGLGWVRVGVAPGQQQLDPLEIRLRPNRDLTVRVVDGDGQAVPGATVWVAPGFRPIGGRRAWRPRLPELMTLFLRETDAEGRATLPELPRPVGREVRDANRQRARLGRYLVRSEAEGIVPGRATVRLRRSGPTKLVVTLRRERRVTIRGRVVTPEGEPVAGVTVDAEGHDVATRTDEEGRYAMEPCAYGRVAVFAVEGPGVPRVRSPFEIPDGGDTHRHDIVVERRAPVTGRVVDQHGAPVAGVELHLGVEGDVHYPSTPERTRDDGRFAFPDAVPSQDDLWVRPPGPPAAWEPSPPRKLSRRDGEEIVLRRFEGELVDLRVTVVDGETGRAAAPGDVELDPLFGSMHPRPELALGLVTADAIRAGRYRLVVRAVDGRRAAREIEVGEGPVTRARLRLWRPATVVCSLDASGVTAAERADARSVVVVLRPQHERAYAVDEQGEPLPFTVNTGIFRFGVRERFRLRRVTPNTLLCLRTAGGELFGETWFRAEPGGQTRVTFRPQRPGALAFGLPADLPAGTVEIHVAGPQDEWRPVLRRRRTDARATTIRMARPPGPVHWRLRLRAYGAAEPIVRTGRHDVVAGATTRVAWPQR